MIKKKYYCSHCKEVVITCDSGWAHKFKNGEKIICKKKPWPQGSLHFCDDTEMDDSILDPDIPVRTRGVNSVIIYK
jgi:hypothetical protein